MKINLKSKALNPKQIQMFKFQMLKTKLCLLAIGISVIGDCLEFRILSLEFILG
jgi:hypothetical protein